MFDAANLGGPLARLLEGGQYQPRQVEDWEAFQKAVTSGDPNVLDFKGELSGVPAIRLEALDGTMRYITEREKTFTLGRRLRKQKVNSSIYEFATKTSIGGYIGSTFNGEYSDIRKQRSAYKRNIVRLKYLMTMQEITVAAKLQNTLENLKAEENTSGTVRILRDMEVRIFNGDEAVVPEEFNGIYTVLENEYPSHIFDLDGSSDTEDFYNANRSAFERVGTVEGGFGEITDCFVSRAVKTDLDRYLDPQFRVNLENQAAREVDYGTRVKGLNTSFGDIALNDSVWIEDGNVPQLTAPAIIAVGSPILGAPGAPELTLTVNETPAGVSRFYASRAGTYYYAVASVSEKGEGPLSSIEAVTVGEGDAVDLEIDANTTPEQTGYVIYRSMQNPNSAPGPEDLRLVRRIPTADLNNPAATTVYQDLNHDLPGSAKSVILELNPLSIDLVELLPLTQFPLYPTVKASDPWALLYFAALRLSVPQRHWAVKNYVPTTSPFKPHG